MVKRTALVTGITGQDGSYLAELLLDTGYEVVGVIRRTSTDSTSRIRHLFGNPKFRVVWGDLTDSASIYNILADVQPTEVYNLAAQSDVGASFGIPEMTGDTTGLGVLRILEGLRQLGLTDTHFYQASSSELFGKVEETPQKETTPMHPRSPYGVAKLYGYWITRHYREAYGMFACNGILFNHESPRRGDNFVTQKIVKGMVNTYLHKQDCLYLGNLDSKRDWGYAADYVYAMALINNHSVADDFVVATGETHTIREFVEQTAKELCMEIEWESRGKEEVGKDKRTHRIFVRIDPKLWRPAEVDLLLGDASKAERELGWTAATKFPELVKLMVDAALK